MASDAGRHGSENAASQKTQYKENKKQESSGHKVKSLARIIYESSIRLGVTPAEVFGDGRHPRVVMVRSVISYALRYHYKPRPTFPEIAAVLREHATASSSIWQYVHQGELMASSPEFVRDLCVVLHVITEVPNPHGFTTADFLDANQNRLAKVTTCRASGGV